MLFNPNPPQQQDGGAFTPNPSPTVICAEITGDSTASALGMTVTSTSPVLALCRKLVEAGVDPATALEAWRGTFLALRVRSIGEGARLQINSSGTGFAPFHAPSAASPMRSRENPARAPTPVPASAPATPSAVTP